MHNPESAVENEMHKFLWGFEIQTDHLIPAKRPDQVNTKKEERTDRIVDFDVLADQGVKSKKRDK